MANKNKLVNVMVILDKARLFESLDGNGIPYQELAVPVSAIEDAPVADARPEVHARWEFGELGALGAPVRCSHCGWGIENADPVLWLAYPGHKFCGACGAIMDLEEG